jgi:hypothetical protein
MATKTFKPGECAHGGLIKVTVSNQIKVAFLDWNTKKPIGIESTFSTAGSRNDIDMFVADHATSYYADQVCEWIDGKVEDKRIFRNGGGW